MIWAPAMVRYDTRFSADSDCWVITANGRELGSVKLKADADTYVDQLRSRHVRATDPSFDAREFRDRMGG
jgi:hypothetical protein